MRDVKFKPDLEKTGLSLGDNGEIKNVLDLLRHSHMRENQIWEYHCYKRIKFSYKFDIPYVLKLPPEIMTHIQVAPKDITVITRDTEIYIELQYTSSLYTDFIKMNYKSICTNDSPVNLSELEPILDSSGEILNISRLLRYGTMSLFENWVLICESQQLNAKNRHKQSTYTYTYNEYIYIFDIPHTIILPPVIMKKIGAGRNRIEVYTESTFISIEIINIETLLTTNITMYYKKAYQYNPRIKIPKLSTNGAITRCKENSGDGYFARKTMQKNCEWEGTYNKCLMICKKIENPYQLILPIEVLNAIEPNPENIVITSVPYGYLHIELYYPDYHTYILMVRINWKKS